MFTIKETNVTIMVADMDKSICFYEKIGLRLRNRWDNHYAQLEGKDLIIGLHPTAITQVSGNNISIGFIVDLLKDVAAHLDAEAISYESSGDKSGNFIHINDPDGTVLYFMQPNLAW